VLSVGSKACEMMTMKKQGKHDHRSSKRIYYGKRMINLQDLHVKHVSMITCLVMIKMALLNNYLLGTILYEGGEEFVRP